MTTDVLAASPGGQRRVREDNHSIEPNGRNSTEIPHLLQPYVLQDGNPGTRNSVSSADRSHTPEPSETETLLDKNPTTDNNKHRDIDTPSSTEQESSVIYRPKRSKVKRDPTQRHGMVEMNFRSSSSSQIDTEMDSQEHLAWDTSGTEHAEEHTLESYV